MSYPTSTFEWKGATITNTWIKTSEIEKYSPITQVYGIIFNDKDEILICRESSSGKWISPRGHPEKGESFEATLKREVLEEVDVEISDIKPLGVFRVEFHDNPDKIIYQSRFIAKLESLLPQTPDPANDNTWVRKFVLAAEVTKYVQWGKTGEARFRDAIELYQTTSSGF